MDGAELVGRDSEIAQLDSAIDAALDYGGPILITGPPGIGKTSLLDAAAIGARGRGYKLLTATGLECEAQFAYAGLHQLLQPVLMLTDKLPAPQKTALMIALGIAAGTAPDVFLVGLATLNLLDETAAEKPTVLIVDDVQWMDGPTSAVLTFIARRLESTSILLFLGLRDEFDSPLRAARLPEIKLGPLDDAAATHLLDTVAPDLEAHVRQRVLEQALGNPLALVELPRSIALDTAPRRAPSGTTPLTERMERAFSAQAAALPQNTQTALLLAALESDPTVAEVVRATSIQSGREMTVEVLEPALDAGLITITDNTIRFRHPLIRSALDQIATPGQRRAAHLALASVVDDQDRRTWHRGASVLGTDDAVATDLQASAARAQDRGATAIALSAQELAASLTSDSSLRARRLLAAAEMASQLGQRAAVRRLLDAAERLELAANDVARMTWLREILNYGVPADASSIANLVDVAVETARQGDPNLALNLLYGAALRRRWATPGSGTRDVIVEALEQIVGRDLDPQALVILSLADPVDAGDLISQRIAQAAMTDVADASRIYRLGLAAGAAGDWSEGLSLLKRAAPGLRAQGRLGLLAQLLTLCSWDEIHVGRFNDANGDADEGLRLAIETAQPIWIAASQIAMALLAGLQGEEAAAERLALKAEEFVLPQHITDLLSFLQFARGLTAMTAGRHSDAYGHFARMIDPNDIAFSETQSYAAAGYLIASAIQAGRRADAERHILTFESLGKRTSASILHMGLRFARAILADDDSAEGLYQIALNTEPKWPFDHARLQMSYGSWLRRQRRISESRPHLRTARDTFEALGVHVWADKARAELRAAGERAAEPTKAPRPSLSPQELQIAQMAASGLSNREIGARLFLSHRTVGAHLYRVFPKVGIASRSELSAALASLGSALE
jgi:DNA-binding CsgD family transcriptional regulator/tetratricopeptide (TPR) repeat protein